LLRSSEIARGPDSDIKGQVEQLVNEHHGERENEHGEEKSFRLPPLLSYWNLQRLASPG
jgi:hypothetical protein